MCRLGTKPLDYLRRDAFNVIKIICHDQRLQKTGACQEAPVPGDYTLYKICERLGDCWGDRSQIDSYENMNRSSTELMVN
jgi:hypothetical protein